MFSKRNQISLLLVLFFLFIIVGFTGCNSSINSSTKSTDIDKTYDFNSFGQTAYHYIEYFQSNLSNRIAATSAEQKTANYLVSELKKAGYKKSQIEIQTFESPDSQNIIVTKKGTSNKVIIVGAHYDCVNTHGIEDNASGVSVVLENALRLVNTKLPYTTKFIFFGAEEIGFNGSTKYVEALSEDEKKNIGCMINLDCIMTGDKAYLFGGTVGKDGSVVDTWAVKKAKVIADALGLQTYFRPNRSINKYPSPVAGNSSDHAPFKENGIPYIFFTSSNYDLAPYDGSLTNQHIKEIIHTHNDNLDILKEVMSKHIKEMLKTYSILLHHLLLNESFLK